MIGIKNRTLIPTRDGGRVSRLPEVSKIFAKSINSMKDPLILASYPTAGQATSSQVGTPESKASGPIGPYWDALRKLKRVTVGGSLTSGLVVSQRPVTASPMSPSPKLVE